MRSDGLCSFSTHKVDRFDGVAGHAEPDGGRQEEPERKYTYQDLIHLGCPLQGTSPKTNVLER